MRTIGALLGGWVAEWTERHLGFVVAMTLVGAAVLLWIDLIAMPQLMTLAVMFAGGLAMGARNTPRDVMVKDAAAPDASWLRKSARGYYLEKLHARMKV